jgi:SAM-dependent methyltransferase
MPAKQTEKQFRLLSSFYLLPVDGARNNMGFVRANALPILKEHKLRPFVGHCLCLGQADIYFTYEHLQRMARIAEIQLLENIPVTPSHRADFAAKNYISRDTFFKSIGFKEVSALDYSSFEGAEFQFDLNSTSLPPNLQNRFDAVINHGTIEHIFHIPNCLANICDMLKVGGRVIHSVPSSNFLDHGFYMFSPTFFYDYYTANRWRLNTIQITQVLNPSQQEVEPPFFADYEPGLFDTLSYGGLDSKAYGTICIATRTHDSTNSVVPQQGYYARMQTWSQSSVVNQNEQLEHAEAKPGFSRRVYRKLKHVFG